MESWSSASRFFPAATLLLSDSISSWSCSRSFCVRSSSVSRLLSPAWRTSTDCFAFIAGRAAAWEEAPIDDSVETRGAAPDGATEARRSVLGLFDGRLGFAASAAGAAGTASRPRGRPPERRPWDEKDSLRCSSPLLTAATPPREARAAFCRFHSSSCSLRSLIAWRRATGEMRRRLSCFPGLEASTARNSKLSPRNNSLVGPRRTRKPAFTPLTTPCLPRRRLRWPLRWKHLRRPPAAAPATRAARSSAA